MSRGGKRKRAWRWGCPVADAHTESANTDPSLSGRKGTKTQNLSIAKKAIRAILIPEIRRHNHFGFIADDASGNVILNRNELLVAEEILNDLMDELEAPRG